MFGREFFDKSPKRVCVFMCECDFRACFLKVSVNFLSRSVCMCVCVLLPFGKTRPLCLFRNDVDYKGQLLIKLKNG